MEILINIAIALAGFILGLVLHEFYIRFSESGAKRSAYAIIRKAKSEAEQIVENAREKAIEETARERKLGEEKIASIKEELDEMKAAIEEEETELDLKNKQLEEQEKFLQQQQQQFVSEKGQLQFQKEKLQSCIDKELKMLQEISHISRDEAKKRLREKIEEEMEEEMAKLIEKHMEKCRENARYKVQEILLMAVQRCAVEHTMDNVISTIDLPNEEMKGRIIGREGRNIRAFEKITGINVIVDDTPGVIVVSGFNPIRREIAKMSMEKLIVDGRIHPARIEEIVVSTEQEMDDIILETGKQVAYEAGIHTLSPKEITLVGRMKFHMVSGQNLLQHTLEVLNLVALMAGELHLDVLLAKRCALLHDIGRTVDDHFEGNHAFIGAEIAKRCAEVDEVVNAIAAHHEDIPAKSLYATLLQVAHSVCTNRPGGKKESLEKHLKRLEKLENIVLSFPEIEQAYVINTGREIRCIADANKISDAKAILLARSIAQTIEREIAYPGEIKISLSRETRVVEYAK